MVFPRPAACLKIQETLSVDGCPPSAELRIRLDDVSLNRSVFRSSPFLTCQDLDLHRKNLYFSGRSRCFKEAKD